MKNLSADFSGFGTREMLIASKLLFALSTNKPDWFSDEPVKVFVNEANGVVYLLTESNVAVLGEGGHGLEPWLSTPYHGKQGTLGDILSENRVSELNYQDVQFLEIWAKKTGREDEFYKWLVKVTQGVESPWVVVTPTQIEPFNDELAANEWARLTREEMRNVSPK
jgi:hypothetical protein